MSFTKKVLILSDVQNNAGTGIMKFSTEGGGTVVNVKLYGLKGKKTTLLLRSEGRLLAFDADENCTLDLKDIDTSLPLEVAVTDDGFQTLYVGSTGADRYKCFNLVDEYKRQISTKTDGENQPETDDENIVEESPVLDENPDISPQILAENTAAADDGAKACVSSDFLGEGVEYSGEHFYQAVKPQLDEMFICYPPENALADIVPNSKWAHVKTEDDYYVVGVIFDLDEPKYVCYGIPGSFAVKPPDKIKNLCDWLPLMLDKPEGDGYWLIYQDAKTGNTLKKNE